MMYLDIMYVDNYYVDKCINIMYMYVHNAYYAACMKVHGSSKHRTKDMTHGSSSFMPFPSLNPTLFP